MQCPYCQETIHDLAKVCRYCGNKTSRRNWPTIVAAIIAVAVIGGAVQALRDTDMSGVQKVATEVDDSVPRPVGDFMAERIVSPHLRDPESARYTGVTYRTRHGQGVLCGGVSSNNGYGGRNGFRAFIATDARVTFAEATPASRWDPLWREMCVDTDASDLAKKVRHKTKAEAQRP